MQKEIFARGPIACTIDAGPIEKYTGGIAKGERRFSLSLGPGLLRYDLPRSPPPCVFDRLLPDDRPRYLGCRLGHGPQGRPLLDRKQRSPPSSPSPSLSPAAPFARQVRNSWGEYWGEQGYVNVKSGALALERSCAWATVADFTAPEKKNQYHCFEDGSNCDASKP